VSDEYLPKQYKEFNETFPDVGRAFSNLGLACHNAGPLDPKTRYLVKLGVASAIQSEGAVKSHARKALDAGAKADELRHAVVLALTTAGFPKTIAALGWITEVLEARA
jgi:4-carboxymuconolactone decarboxylase